MEKKCHCEGCEGLVEFKVWDMYKDGTEGRHDERYSCKEHLGDALEFDNTMIVTSTHPTVIGNPFKGLNIGGSQPE